MNAEFQMYSYVTTCGSAHTAVTVTAPDMFDIRIPKTTESRADYDNDANKYRDKKIFCPKFRAVFLREKKEKFYFFSTLAL